MKTRITAWLVVVSLAALGGCAAREPWERTWPAPDWRTLRDEPPYLWCGLETPELVRPLVGAFPLGSSRKDVEATIQRLHLDSLVVERPSADSPRAQRLHLTAGGLLSPAEIAGKNDIVLHINNWFKYEPGVIRTVIDCPYRVWLRFDGEFLRTVELRQEQHIPMEWLEAGLSNWREEARDGIVVFTYGMIADDDAGAREPDDASPPMPAR